MNLSRAELAATAGREISGWMNSYGRFRRSELYPLPARISYRIQQRMRRKYKRLRPVKAMQAAWERVTAQYPRLFPHWQWDTRAWQ